jgi:hypothetical protein
MDNRHLLADVRVGLGHVALHSGDYMDARHYYTESLAHYQAGNQPGVAKILAGLGLVALTQGDHAQARRYFLESLQAGIAAGAPPVILNTMMGIAELFMRQGDLTSAVRLLQSSSTIPRVLHARKSALDGCSHAQRRDCSPVIWKWIISKLRWTSWMR